MEQASCLPPAVKNHVGVCMEIGVYACDCLK